MYPLLRSGAQNQLKRIGEADLVIGLPSYKNGSQAAHVTRIALEGIRKHYPHLRSVLINADAGYETTTRLQIAGQACCHTQVVTGRYDGTLGWGNAVASLLDAALALDAKAIVILDSNTQSITPDWIIALSHLILENKADLVMPRYQWNAPSGMLSNLIVYPLFRALWGKSVRHPAAPDFAISPHLANAILDEDIWETDVAGSGLSVWLSSYAVHQNWRIAQSALGQKQHDFYQVHQLDEQFDTKFHKILTIMLSLVHQQRENWQESYDYHSLPILTRYASNSNFSPLSEIDPAPLLDKLAVSWFEYRHLWRQILMVDNLSYLEALASLQPEQFYFPSDLWARIIYDFAVVFNKGEHDPYQIINALYPLYQGRLAAFFQEIAGLSLVAQEGTIAAQATEFEEEKSYLRKRWYAYQAY